MRSRHHFAQEPCTSDQGFGVADLNLACLLHGVPDLIPQHLPMPNAMPASVANQTSHGGHFRKAGHDSKRELSHPSLTANATGTCRTSRPNNQFHTFLTLVTNVTHVQPRATGVHASGMIQHVTVSIYMSMWLVLPVKLVLKYSA